ncbi:MAG: NYN domain-containing protein [Firmicutes bacterium]|nr:NYN domain-containing protein [Bacillota bacterium]
MLQLLIVDGYNIINNWPELSALKQANFGASRCKLIQVLQECSPGLWHKIIIVFDAYKVKGQQETHIRLGPVEIIYTKEGETADNLIERIIRPLVDEYDVAVASSDALEQSMILGKGARRISARELKKLIRKWKNEMRKDYLETKKFETKNPRHGHLDHDIKELFEKWRRS